MNAGHGEPGSYCEWCKSWAYNAYGIIHESHCIILAMRAVGATEEQR
jgi:hypothetical protein